MVKALAGNFDYLKILKNKRSDFYEVLNFMCTFLFIFYVFFC